MRRTSALLVSLLAFVLLLTACQDPNLNAGKPERIPVKLSLAAIGFSPAGFTPMAVPPDVNTAEVQVFLTDGGGGRTLEQTVPLTLADPTAEVELLAGEVYDFELSLKDGDGIEVAFDLEQHTISPDLTVRFEPRAIIADVRLGDTFYDGTYLLVPIEVLTPAGTVAPHTDYELDISVTGAAVQAQSPIGITVLPDDAGSPVTLDVTVSGLTASRRSEQLGTRQFTLIPSGVTPGTVALDADLIAPTVEFTSSTDDMQVGMGRYLRVQASDNLNVARVRLYVNMELVADRKVDRPTYDANQFYYFQPDEARTHTLHAVAEDDHGNIGMDMIRIKAY